MTTKNETLLALTVILLASTVFNSIVYAAEERRVLSRMYIGLGVEVYAPYQSYPDETITVRIAVEALEDIKNVSATLFISGSKAEGHSPWDTSFTVFDVEDLSSSIKNKTFDVNIPSDISPGSIYGTLLVQWSTYRNLTWEQELDKPSFRVTYVKNKDYEDLQTTLQNTTTLMYVFLATTVTLAISTAYFARKKPKAKNVRRVK